jgi:hypothetical protein
MAEWSANNSADRANQVWERLLGCFGASLISKFGEEPPQEWASGISMLNDYQLAQGMRRMVYSGKAHPPTLPEFMKLCRTVGYADDVPDRPALPANPALEGPVMGPWEMLGNRRLLKYITTHVSVNPERYGRPASPEGMKFSKESSADASPEFVRNVQTLVAMKNRWVELMLASATEDGVPIREQEDCWNGCMKQAEEIIAGGA